MHVAITKTILEYDHLPVVFLAEGAGKTFVGIAVSYGGDDEYLLAQIDPERVPHLLHGEIDLREVFKAPIDAVWYRLVTNDYTKDVYEITLLNEVDEAMFPSENCFLKI
jgi:hypothetical protein